MNKEKQTTHFGFRKVPVNEKVKHVAGVFHSVANKYDIMNDVMSMGIHRLWKKFIIDIACVRKGDQILDLAGGTGDLALAFSKEVGDQGHVILSDINASMLAEGQDRLINKGAVHNTSVVQANAEQLPFADEQFNCITIAFGLRNVTDKDKALKSMLRCLKPGGQVLVLEFSKPTNPLFEKMYDQYSFNVIPTMGKFITGDAASYQYLVESIHKHPPQDELREMMLAAGYDHVDYHNLTGGIVAVHRGIKKGGK